ncbi:AAA family ATPase [Vibrio alginolyticus]|uniref:ATP-dependent nuclease n=1 Tax=Vibrio alginolyticus TaxID=663 RepID=UPI00215E7D39|nr:AAA family ATPase [Vibrio alginolyticus]MCS0182637.1 AAA family ATPase [Vibrio alginolyticus]
MIKLEKIAISGFKGISERVEIPAKDFNVIVGKNDAGKSTVLKALDLFINTKQYQAEYLNNTTEQFSIIELYFCPNHTQIVIDENTTTTFEAEGLVNSDGYLHLTKRWDGTKSGKISPEYFVERLSFGELDFFSLTEAKLIKLCRDNGLEAEPGLMTNPDTGEAHNNAEKRNRLREFFIARGDESSYISEKLPTSGSSRLKKTESAIKSCLPRFEYFVADAPLSESDSTIQKYFKDMAFKVIQEQVDTEELEETVKGHLQTVLSAITSKINAVVPESEQVHAKVEFDWSKLITTTFDSDNGNGSVPLSARGDGFRRITMMAYFEYLAEQKSSEIQNIIFGFEEPETFLHPSAQENLFEKLNDISVAGYQVFLTTHSPVIVSKTQKSDLHRVYKEAGSYACDSSVNDHSGIASDLGITIDNQFISLFDNTKCFLLVEGIDDCVAFEHLANTYKDNGIVEQNFADLGVVTIPVGGCGSIKHWVTLDLLQTLNKPFFIFLDSDKTSEDEASPNAEKLAEYGFVEGENFTVSKKREIENYMSPAGIERLVPGANLAFTDWCDVKALSKSNDLAGALGGKKIANKLFPSLTFEELRETFFNGEVDEFVELHMKVSALAD